jgi:hypothetical protein
MTGTNVPISTRYEGRYLVAEYANRKQPITIFTVGGLERVVYFTASLYDASEWIRRQPKGV